VLPVRSRTSPGRDTRVVATNPHTGPAIARCT
jgi:hypothetical protein